MTSEVPAVTQRQREALEALCEPGTFILRRRTVYESDQFWIGDERLPMRDKLHWYTAAALVNKRLIDEQLAPDRGAALRGMDVQRHRITELGLRAIGRQP